MTVARVLLGLIVYVAVGCSVSQAMPDPDSLLSLAGQVGLASFLGSLIGTFVARSHFLLPMLFVWLASWAGIIYVLHLAAVPSGGRGAFISALAENWLSLVVSLLTLIVGWASARIVGRLWSRHRVAI